MSGNMFLLLLMLAGCFFFMFVWPVIKYRRRIRLADKVMSTPEVRKQFNPMDILKFKVAAKNEYRDDLNNAFLVAGSLGLFILVVLVIWLSS